MTNELTQRIIRLLRKANDWVSRKELCARARAKHYAYEEINASLEELEEQIELGTKSEHGRWHRWYDMSDEERLKYIGWRNAFDEVGD